MRMASALSVLLLALSPGIVAAQAWPGKLHEALQDYEAADAASDRQKPNGIFHYRYAQVDLNGDEWTDALVLVQQTGYCGTGGCTLLLLAGTAEGFTLVDRSPLSREPIELTEQWRDGWRTLVTGRGGGGVPYGLALTWFDGNRYTGGLVEDDDPRLVGLGRRERLELIEVGDSP